MNAIKSKPKMKWKKFVVFILFLLQKKRSVRKKQNK